MTLEAQQTLEIRECGQCGLLFAAPRTFMDQQRRLGAKGGFYCPAGHCRVFSENTESRLKREKNEIERRLQAELNESKHARLVAEKAQKKAILEKRKVELRIAHGVCPCCNKAFVDIANHMVTEHKDFRLPGGKEQKRLTA